MFLISNKSSIYNIGFSSEIVVWPESGEKYAQIKHHLQAKKHFKQKCWWILM